MLGMGMMLQERADYSPQGQPLYNSTWTYKIPAASCIPRVFNIGLLAVGAPCPRSHAHRMHPKEGPEAMQGSIQAW